MAETGEGLWMSAKERDRLKVLHEVKKRHITQKQAAAELGLSVRWVRELVLRLRAGGDAGLGHGLRGRRSNRKTSETVKQRAVELYRQKKQAKLWHDYGPTLAGEELAEQYGITISRETLRPWLIEAKLWRGRRARGGKAHCSLGAGAAPGRGPRAPRPPGAHGGGGRGGGGRGERGSNRRMSGGPGGRG